MQLRKQLLSERPGKKRSLPLVKCSKVWTNADVFSESDHLVAAGKVPGAALPAV
jgi:hypothetical protein